MTTPLLATFGNIFGMDGMMLLIIVLVLFGAKKLPELARGLGQSLNEFRKAREDFENELHQANPVNNPPTPREAQNRQPYNAPNSTATTEAELRRQLQEAQEALRAVQQQKAAPQLLEPGTATVVNAEEHDRARTPVQPS